MRECTFSWEGEDQKLLEGINFRARAGELVGVVGKIGAGKTSLLCSILGETVMRIRVNLSFSESSMDIYW